MQPTTSSQAHKTGAILAPPGLGGLQKLGVVASAVARAYDGGLRWSPQRSPGAEPLVTGSGAKPPEAESFSAFGRLT